LQQEVLGLVKDVELQQQKGAAPWKTWDYSPLFWVGMIAVLVILMGLPLFWLGLKSFFLPETTVFSLQNYIDVFSSKRMLNAILNSLLLATGVGVMSVAIGVPMAWAVTRTTMPLRGLMRTLLLVAFTTPHFLGGIAWILLAAPNSGWLNRVYVAFTGAEQGPFNVYSLWGAIFVVGIYSYPYAFLLTSSALEFVSSELEDAATVLGAGTFATTLRITLPLVLPSILSGFLLSFLEAIALFGSPTLLLIPARVPIITTEIWQLFQFPPNVELASAFSISLILITVVLLWLQRRLLAQKGYTTLTGKGGRKRLLEIGLWKWVFLLFCLLVSSLSLFLPFYMLCRTSLSKAWGQPFTANNMTLQWYDDVLFKLPFTKGAILNTLLYSVAAAVFAMGLGIAIAYIVNHKLIRGWRILGFLPMIPLAIPGIVIAVGIFASYSRPPLLLYGTGLILVVAYTTRFVPIAFSNAVDIFKSINPEMELAARNLGASQVSTIQKITVPLVQRGLIGGLILVFILSVRELSCAILLSSARSQVMATVLFDLVNEGSFERVAALGVVMLVIVFGAVGLAYRLLGQDFMLEKG
jgi:iron(III) transport system permease protein